MKLKSVQDCLTSEDPLSSEAFNFLLSYKEEDDLVDFKVDFDLHKEKGWLEITKDIMAFANTHGGYLVFGVLDGTFDLVGLDENVVKVLIDTDRILQKINRHLDPPISLLRSKKFIKDQKQIIGLYIPASLGVTHMISKDGSFKYPTGKEKVVLRKGTMYVRRSAGNHLVDARGMDGIVHRRLKYFKESLLDNIAQIVEAPTESKVFVMSNDSDIEGVQKFTIANGSEAIPIKGMSFSIAPKTTEEYIAAWAVIFLENKESIPPTPVLWDWYKNRHSINLSEEYRIIVAEFCVFSTKVPPFFWLQKCSSNVIKEMLKDALKNKSSVLQISTIQKIAAFLGKGFYNSISKGNNSSKKYSKKYPRKGPKSLCNQDFIKATRNR